MSKLIKEEWFLRTEILPTETPNFFSNTPIIKNLDQILKDDIVKKINDKKSLKKATVPMSFNIPKNDGGKRKVSILHPRAQLNYLFYMKKYEYLLINSLQKSSFNSRKVSKFNKFTYNDRKAIRKKETNWNRTME